VRCGKGEEEKSDKTSWDVKNKKADTCGMIQIIEKNRSRSVSPDHQDRYRFT